jgi:crotonobetainyl-CoA:carnitine CoA-transferase CaiB-like acyl-CoA transferase
MIVQALSGSMSLTGEENGHPVRTGIPLGDLAAGLHAVIGVLAALQRRNATGLGDFIDISMLDCLVAMLNYQGSYYLNSGVVPGLQGTGHDSVPTYRAFATKGGTDLVTTANTERMWSSMATILGCGHLLSDDRFTTNTDRLRNKHALWDIIEPAFLQRPAVEWLKLFNEASIPAAIVKDLAAALSDPQVLHREMIIQLEDADGTTVRTVGNPIKLQDAVAEKHSFPPRKGADGVSILHEVLGLDPATIQSLAQRGVVVLDQPDRPDVHSDESRPSSRIPTA